MNRKRANRIRAAVLAVALAGMEWTPSSAAEPDYRFTIVVLERATAYEIQRQIREWVDTGELGKKSTYGWDEATESTFFQRFKEGESDYRYFPDPDLVPVEVDEAWLAQIKSQVGEQPAARRQRYIEALGLSPADATTLAGDRATGDYYEHALKAGGALYCWGSNSVGQVGDNGGSSVDGGAAVQQSPVPIAAGTSWSDLSAGNTATCGVTTTGSLRCWGYLASRNDKVPAEIDTATD